ncbi:Beta-galactosidase C-terminal domain [Kitasatospora sp. NPDC085895]|uniref:Beta-galactosidase C-terminal domain n=1 Tax=Kitasatospora sp. NPDC085895 TaxID=3155057 RepID=UPI00344BCE39
MEQVGELGRHLLAINHGDRGAQVPLPGAGMELLTGLLVEGVLEVPAGAVRVVHL